MPGLDPAGYGVLPLPEVPSEIVAPFDCGKTHLNEFLRQKASDTHERRLGFTSIVFHEQIEGPIAYFTLANDAVLLTTSEQFALGLAESGLTGFPAVKLGRLAVRADLQSQGIGDHVLSVLVMGEIVASSSLTAARLVVLDADRDDRTIAFYERIGFERSLHAEKRAKGQHSATVKMHLDLVRWLGN